MKMRLLELFSGTGSVGHALRAQGWEVLSLDKNPKANPDICEDIRFWNFMEYPPEQLQRLPGILIMPILWSKLRCKSWIGFGQNGGSWKILQQGF